MLSLPRVLLVLHHDRALRNALDTIAAEDDFELRVLETWAALQDAVSSAPASARIVVDPYFTAEQAGELSPELSRLLHRYPSLAVAAALEVRPERVSDLRTLASWGVAEILDLQTEVTPQVLGSRLLAISGLTLQRHIEQILPPNVGGAARSILAAAAGAVAEGRQGEELARTLQISPRTLSRWCRRAALPPPKQLLGWMRVLLAAELLDDSGRTVSEVAAACGYAADSSLRHALRGFLGMSPSELRDRGAFSTAANAFVSALAEARRASTRYR